MSWIDELVGVLKSKTAEPKPPTEEDLKQIATEVGTKLVSGELEPTTEVIKSFVRTKGLSEEDADEFAVEALSAFFDVDNHPEPAPVQKSGGAGQGTATISKADFDELKSSVDVIGKAVVHLMQKSTASQDLVGEIEKLKSELIVIGGQSADPKKPVEHAQDKPGVANMNRDVLKSKLLQGVTSGQLTIGDLGVFEIGNTLTKNAEIYLAGQK
jgi:hypothetical protein